MNLVSISEVLVAFLFFESLIVLDTSWGLHGNKNIGHMESEGGALPGLKI